MLSRWEDAKKQLISSWEESVDETVELVEIFLSCTSVEYASGTSFEQWLAFFNMEQILKENAEDDGYVIVVKKKFFSDPGVVKALELMKNIVDSNFEEYLDKAKRQRSTEQDLIKALDERDAAEQRADAAKKRADACEEELELKRKSVRELEQAIAKLAPPPKK